jgi:hypothetical protein
VEQKPQKIDILTDAVRGRAPGQRQWSAQRAAALQQFEYECCSLLKPWPQASVPAIPVAAPAFPIAAPTIPIAAPAIPVAAPTALAALVTPPNISIPDWLSHCDRHPDRRGDNLGGLATKFHTQGFRRLQQLTGNNCVDAPLHLPAVYLVTSNILRLPLSPTTPLRSIDVRSTSFDPSISLRRLRSTSI